jgi:DNA-binding NarL/FixJ family response regulator
MDLVEQAADEQRRESLKDLTVILCEDNAVIRRIVLDVLQDIGIEDIRHAREPEEALKAFGERAAHIVFVEVGKGDDPAIRLLKTIKSSEFYESGVTGLIALAPYPSRDVVFAARRAGAEVVIAEPIAPDQLAEHVETVGLAHLSASRAARKRTDRS